MCVKGTRDDHDSKPLDTHVLDVNKERNSRYLRLEGFSFFFFTPSMSINIPINDSLTHEL